LALHRLARTNQFTDGAPILAEVDGVPVAIYRFRDRYFAYLNRCPHQGGPACEGKLLGSVECEVYEGGKMKEYISTERYNITCPWHGMEFDLETGICRSDSRDKLRAYRVVIDGDDVCIEK